MIAGEVRSGALCVLFTLLVACATGPATSAGTAPATSTQQPAPSGATALRLDPDSEGARDPQLARYRPPGARPYLDALDQSPASPAALLEAARFYATGDVAGMSLLWLMMRASTSPDVPMEESGRLYADILRRRVEQTGTASWRTLSIRLAPGAGLVIATENGRVGALAHMLETELGVAMSRFALRDTDEWTQSSLVETLRFMLQSYRQGESIVHPHVEWVAWAEALERAGHLEAFVARLVGTSMPAGPTPAATDTARAAEAAYVAAHPFHPTRSILPDDFIPVP